MKLLEKNNLFKGYSDLLLLGVYTDKIIAEIARKEKDGVKIIASTEEPMEDGHPRTERAEQSRRTQWSNPRQGDEASDEASHDGISAEKIRLNCEKAIQRLPAEQIAGVKSIAYVLGGGVAGLSFSVERVVRENRDKKISVQELSALAGENKADSAIVEKRFLVDGFAIEDPIGMEGKEISALVTHFNFNGNLEKALASIAETRGMTYEGVLDARIVFIKSGLMAPKDYCAIFIFSEKTAIYVVRGEFISAVSDIGAGYGIMTEKTASAFGVGFEEGKDLLNKFRNNQIDQSASEAIKTALEEAAAEITDKVRAALSVIDKENLIPGNVFVVINENFPELGKTLSGAQWLDGLPIDRNASVRIEPDAIHRAVLNYINNT